jgi:hypothetical protein
VNRIIALALVSLSASFALAACSKNDTSSAAASPAPAAVAATATPAAEQTAALPAVSAAATAVSPASASPAAGVAYTDIAGVNGETSIRQLGALGVFGATVGAFEPGKPILRRDFIRWLVKANKALWSDTPGKQVHTADSTEQSTFPDVASSDPDFPYVQGMQDAGYSVGFPDKMFRPNSVLTREQMFAIKNVFDRGSVDAGLVKNLLYARNTALPPWKDRAQISKTYVPAIATGNPAGVDDAFTLVYGASSLFHPQLAATRAQAAVLLTVMGDHTFYGGGRRTAAGALASASPAP